MTARRAYKTHLAKQLGRFIVDDAARFLPDCAVRFMVPPGWLGGYIALRVFAPGYGTFHGYARSVPVGPEDCYAEHAICWFAQGCYGRLDPARCVGECRRWAVPRPAPHRRRSPGRKGAA